MPAAKFRLIDVDVALIPQRFCWTKENGFYRRFMSLIALTFGKRMNPRYF